MEISFWEDETLLDNLTDDLAVPILHWIESAIIANPDSRQTVLNIAKILNKFAVSDSLAQDISLIRQISDLYGDFLQAELQSNIFICDILIKIQEAK
jgi:hypothetical protein